MTRIFKIGNVADRRKDGCSVHGADWGIESRIRPSEANSTGKQRVINRIWYNK